MSSCARPGSSATATFKALLQAMLNAIPRSRIKGKFVRPEAEVLENMRLAFFDELVPPVEEDMGAPAYVQLGLDEVHEDEGDELDETAAM